MSSPYGPLFTPDQLEADAQAVIDPQAGGWLLHYLADIERTTGKDAETYVPPASWDITSDFRTWRDELFPAIVIVAAGTDEPPRRHGDGTYDETYRLQFLAIVAAASRQDARALSGIYCTAIKGAVLQQLVAASDLVSDVVYRGFRSDPLAANDQRTIAGGAVAFDVTVPGTVTDIAGITEPPVDPYTPPGEEQTVLTADVRVNPAAD